MVDYIEKSFWKCPYCKKEYDTWEDALECAEECADIDYPKEDKKTFAVCEFCKKEYDDDEEAEGCEEYHAEEQDKIDKEIFGELRDDLIKIKLNCCDNNSRVIKQTKEITYFKCDICKREFSYGTEEEVNN